ncbi:MAG: hypothetical protein M3N98_09790 [Actinomycetota bacterium]|nr:hypothetical protein [Actinomycetota bacterium]
MGSPNTVLATLRPAPEAYRREGENSQDGDDVGGLVMGAADGDDRAWRELIGRFSPLVQSIVGAHRLGDDEAVDVIDAVWLQLDRQLGRIRQPDHVGAWLAAVTRHECVRRLTGQD